ncbi:hypothetical protein [Asticcacaulis tiandongensis]|uniref:hypothetical protein n=1 Tax=Asticcacaulis tiandongensis TaxID=2565365 RepID=UPI00112D5978|nr:hypothetical protein [Asticcacaulis tiandongensis]
MGGEILRKTILISVLSIGLASCDKLHEYRQSQELKKELAEHKKLKAEREAEIQILKLSFLKTCEDEFKKRLKSPISYLRYSEKTSINVSSQYGYEKSCRGDWCKGKTITIKEGDKRWNSIIEYDASNSFGAMIRGRYECDYFGNDFSNETNLLIDGMTPSEYSYQSAISKMRAIGGY